MVDVRVLLESVNILFEAIIWEMAPLSDKYESASLYSAKAKSCSTSIAWLACWKPAWVALKFCSSHN